ncbi:MAG: hypothetical protein HY671_10390 [Chloroflexi bacterium]|nr:hypothetical protein [Chloroflexota bacterium]
MSNRTMTGIAAGIALLGLLAASCSQAVSPSAKETPAPTAPATLSPAPIRSRITAAERPTPPSPIPTTPTAAPTAAPTVAVPSRTAISPVPVELLVLGQPTQSHAAGAMTIQATPQGKLVTGTRELTFQIVMDTHSVDLDVYDLKELTVLRNGAGGEFKPTSWQAPKGGHHRDGTLAFASPDTSGLLTTDSRFMELYVKDMNKAGHTLRWELRLAS